MNENKIVADLKEEMDKIIKMRDQMREIGVPDKAIEKAVKIKMREAKNEAWKNLPTKAKAKKILVYVGGGVLGLAAAIALPIMAMAGMSKDDDTTDPDMIVYDSEGNVIDPMTDQIPEEVE